MPPFNYRYATDILDQLDANGVSWMAVEFVLQISHPKIRRWVFDDVVQIIATDDLGQLLMVTLQEQPDGALEVVSARYLDGGEADAVTKE